MTNDSALTEVERVFGAFVESFASHSGAGTEFDRHDPANTGLLTRVEASWFRPSTFEACPGSVREALEDYEDDMDEPLQPRCFEVVRDGQRLGWLGIRPDACSDWAYAVAGEDGKVHDADLQTFMALEELCNPDES